MTYQTAGKSGLKISRLGLGTLNFGAAKWGCDEKTSIDLIHAYLDMGGNYIDTADLYSKGISEGIVGKAIKERRQDVILSSKCGVPLNQNKNRRGASRYHITLSIDESLKRLQTDYIDLYFLHTYDPTTPFEESIRALTDAVKSGKIRYIGLSNYTGWQISEFSAFSKHNLGFEPIVAVQNEYSMVFRGCEYEVVSSCLYNDVGIICYSPLGGGLLAGVYDPETKSGDKSERYSSGEMIEKKFRNLYLTDKNFEIYKKAVSVAGELKTNVATLSIAWLLKRPAVTCVLLGPKNMDHLKTGMEAEDIAIPDEYIHTLNEVSLPDLPYPYNNQNRIIPEFFSGIARPKEFIEIKHSLLPDILK